MSFEWWDYIKDNKKLIKQKLLWLKTINKLTEHIPVEIKGALSRYGEKFNKALDEVLWNLDNFASHIKDLFTEPTFWHHNMNDNERIQYYGYRDSSVHKIWELSILLENIKDISILKKLLTQSKSENDKTSIQETIEKIQKSKQSWEQCHHNESPELELVAIQPIESEVVHQSHNPSLN